MLFVEMSSLKWFFKLTLTKTYVVNRRSNISHFKIKFIKIKHTIYKTYFHHKISYFNKDFYRKINL